MRDGYSRIGRRGLLGAAVGLAALGALAGCAAEQSDLSPQDAADVARIEAYLNSLGAVEGRFMQIWPDGGQSTGTAYFQAPDRLRLTYDPPTRLVMVAADGELVVHNYADDAVTRVALSNTPLGLLLHKPVELTSDDVAVTSVKRNTGALQVSVARKGVMGAGLLTLIFRDQGGAAGLSLSGIDMVDAAGHDTRLRLFDQHQPQTLDPTLFDAAKA